MNCDISEEQLWSWIDGDSPELAAHLAECPRCRELAGNIRAGMKAAAAGAKSLSVPLPEKVGPYVVKALLGEGGQGLVYEAEQQSPQRPVALKVLKGGRCTSRHDVRHFQRESQTLAALNHPGIATIYEAGRTEEGQHYFAMELVAGEPLDVYVRERSVPREGRLELFRKVCAAVQYAHEHGVIHRDLKPSNILIVKDGTDEHGQAGAEQRRVTRAKGNGAGRGQPKILDFGLARITDVDITLTAEATGTGPIMGTLRYMSPEQACGHTQEIDARSDVYALGVILYELLTDRPPYALGPAMPEAVRTICERPPERLARTCRALRGDLETIALKALEKEPPRRYQSVEELGADVGRFLSGDPILAQRPSRFYILRKKVAKHRLGFGLAGLAVVLGMAGLYAGILWKQHEVRYVRTHALDILRFLEISDQESVGSASRQAGAFFARYPDVPEVLLVYVRGLYEASRYEVDDFLLDGFGVLQAQVTSEPSRWALYLLLAEIYEEAGRFEEATRIRLEGTRAATDTADGWYFRSLATLDIDQARRCAERAVAYDPAHSWAWHRLAYLCLQVKDYQATLRATRRLQVLEKTSCRWLGLEGRAFAERGQYGKAVELYGRVTTAAPSNASGYLCLAHVYFCLNQNEGAIENYTRAIAICGPSSAVKWMYYRRANPYWMTGRLEEAEADYRKFIELAAPATRGHARLFLVLHDRARQLEMRGGGADVEALRHRARAELESARRSASSEGWLDSVFRCLLGECAPEELVRAAKSPEQLCEAYYYAGEACLLNARINEAGAYLQKCIETDLVFDPNSPMLDPMSEYHLARWRLRQLADGDETSSPGSGE